MSCQEGLRKFGVPWRERAWRGVITFGQRRERGIGAVTGKVWREVVAPPSALLVEPGMEPLAAQPSRPPNVAEPSPASQSRAEKGGFRAERH